MPVRATLIGLTVTVAVDVALLRSLGADGLAVGNAAGVSVMALLLIWDMRRRVVNVNSRRLASFFVRVFGAVLLASCCALPVVLLKALAGLPVPATLLLGGAILGVAYLVLARLFRIGEVEELQNQTRRMLSRRGRE